ncbi:PAS domain S-box protein, partial [Haladaptatus sp. W1]|uniref:PAS domain S-box protein n=1 Tax=Haladaptatus sp. W1 TaxID=1897478 RepID=UPI000AB5BA40
MSSHAPSSATVLKVFDTLSSPGIPLTTTEVADEFDCTARTIYNKLDALVEEGAIETKKVGARGRVWWRPPPEYDRQHDHEVNFHRTDEPGIPSYESMTDILSGSEMGKRIHEKDWAETSIGPIDKWPQELRVGVEIMLGASEAIGIYWGSNFTLLYNDAWRKLIGEKHPDALGQPAQEVFAERWKTIGPLLEPVMSGTGAEEKRKPLLAFNDGEANENTWIDYSFSPISGTDGSIEGIFNIAVEVTKHKQAQEELQKQAVLDAFRVELTDELRSIVNPVEIQATASRLLGEQLEASLSYYYQYDAEVGSGVVHRDYRRDGGASITGRYTLEEFPKVHKLVSDGDPLVITDMLTDTRLTATDRDNFDALDFRSSVFVPLVKDGQLVAVFSVGQSTPREWTDTEIAMVEETAERTWAAVERANAEQALRESEERYRTLFESIDEGYCIIEVLFDEDEDPVDYRFLETNPVFEEQTGLVDAKGKLMRELEPHHEEHWFETYGRIALTGEPERFTNEAKYLDERWYDVYAFRIGEPEKRKVAILFNDISDRKHTQRSLERLNDASRELMTADTQEIT